MVRSTNPYTLPSRSAGVALAAAFCVVLASPNVADAQGGYCQETVIYEGGGFSSGNPLTNPAAPATEPVFLEGGSHSERLASELVSSGLASSHLFSEELLSSPHLFSGDLDSEQKFSEALFTAAPLFSILLHSEGYSARQLASDWLAAEERMSEPQSEVALDADMGGLSGMSMAKLVRPVPLRSKTTVWCTNTFSAECMPIGHHSPINPDLTPPDPMAREPEPHQARLLHHTTPEFLDYAAQSSDGIRRGIERPPKA